MIPRCFLATSYKECQFVPLLKQAQTANTAHARESGRVCPNCRVLRLPRVLSGTFLASATKKILTVLIVRSLVSEEDGIGLLIPKIAYGTNTSRTPIRVANGRRDLN